MGTVIKMQARQPGKTSQLLIDALEAEKQTDNPIVVIALDEQNKRTMQQILRCMTGGRQSQIRIQTPAEFRTSQHGKVTVC
jgi:hypothetical protein